jgi:hypothetical protein
MILTDLSQSFIELHVDMVVLLPLDLELFKNNRLNLFAINLYIPDFVPFLYNLRLKHVHLLLIQSGCLPQLCQSLFIQLNLDISTMLLFLNLRAHRPLSLSELTHFQILTLPLNIEPRPQLIQVESFLLQFALNFLYFYLMEIL